MKSILDSTFKYTSAAATDVAKTFARVRREQAAARQSALEAQARKVTALPVKREGGK